MAEQNSNPAPVLPLAYRAIDDEKRIADSELQTYGRCLRRVILGIGTWLLLLGIGNWLADRDLSDVPYLLAWGGATMVLVLPWPRPRQG